MSDLPERPEYDDRPDRDQWGLVMPFTCVASKDGPYDDVPFVAGFQAGQIDGRLARRDVRAATELIYAALEQQVDLIAMRHGYKCDVLDRTDDGEWVHVGFDREDEEDADMSAPLDLEQLRRRHAGEAIANPALLAALQEAQDALRAAREELTHWGWGDMHYSVSSPQEKRVVDAIAAIDAVLGGVDETTGD